MSSPDSKPTPTPLVLDLDQHLHRSALLESIRFLELLNLEIEPSRVSARNLIAAALLRLTYLAIHLRIHSEIRSEILSLHRSALRHLSQTLQTQSETHQEILRDLSRTR